MFPGGFAFKLVVLGLLCWTWWTNGSPDSILIHEHILVYLVSSDCTKGPDVFLVLLGNPKCLWCSCYTPEIPDSVLKSLIVLYCFLSHPDHSDSILFHSECTHVDLITPLYIKRLSNPDRTLIILGILLWYWMPISGPHSALVFLSLPCIPEWLFCIQSVTGYSWVYYCRHDMTMGSCTRLRNFEHLLTHVTF